MIKKYIILTFMIFMWCEKAHADLLKSDFYVVGDGFIITDTSTHTEWLSPLATSGKSINSILSGYKDLTTTQGFTYATPSQVLSMIETNFAPIPSYPGSVAGYKSVSSFFDVFGIAEDMWCVSGACPRTQGFALDGIFASAIGAIKSGINGYLINNYYGTSINNISGDPQFGSWLVRPSASSVQVPGPEAGAGFGALAMAGIALWVKRRRKSKTFAA